MVFLVASTTFMSIGHFPIVPFCFAAIGDLFDPSERAKWTGLLNLPSGIAALLGPMLGGVITESLFGWRGLYWGVLPLMVGASVLVILALPKNVQLSKPKIDWFGAIVMAVATTTLIIGFFQVGVPGHVGVGTILLIVSVIAWIAFIRIENRAEAPILDPEVLFNRTFITAAGTGMLMFLGTVGGDYRLFAHLRAGGDAGQPEHQRFNADALHSACGFYGQTSGIFNRTI